MPAGGRAIPRTRYLTDSKAGLAARAPGAGDACDEGGPERAGADNVMGPGRAPHKRAAPKRAGGDKGRLEGPGRRVEGAGKRATEPGTSGKKRPSQAETR